MCSIIFLSVFISFVLNIIFTTDVSALNSALYVIIGRTHVLQILDLHTLMRLFFRIRFLKYPDIVATLLAYLLSSSFRNPVLVILPLKYSIGMI